MKNNNNYFKHFKRGIALLTASFFLCFSAAAQQVTTTSTTVVLTEKTRLMIQQDPTNQNARHLFNEVHNVTLTDEQFVERGAMTTENIEAWEVVLVYFKDDTSADLTYIQNVVDKMKEKMQYHKTH